MRPLVWFDALTAKQLLIGVSIKRYLEQRGFEVLLTARDYDVIRGLIERISVEARVYGTYREDPYEKLYTEGQRISESSRILSDYRDRFFAGVSYPNPVEARVVYGLGRPLVIVSDSPHSRHPHILSLPLARYLVYSSCIPETSWREYIHPRLVLYPYRGLDELSWVRHVPEVFSERFVRELGLEPLGYVVLRPEESKASYYVWGPRTELWARLAERAVSRGLSAVVLPRYGDQRRILEERLREHIERGRVVVPSPEKAVGPALVRHSVLVVTGGGTMAREAAILGVPGVTTFPQRLDVDRCVEEAGLPMFYISSYEEVSALIDRASRDPEALRRDTRDFIEKMSSPVEAVYSVLKRLYEEEPVEVHGEKQ